MKKSNLFFSMAAGAMLVASCASEQEMPNAPENNEAGKQLITISVANDNDVTRGGRELTSSEAAQAIDNVKLILTDNANNIVWDQEISEWQTSANVHDYERGRYTTVEIPKSIVTLSKSITYKLYGVGYSDDTNYTLDVIKNAKRSETETAAKFFSNTPISLDGNQKEGEWAEEIFAGSINLTGSDNGVKAELVLHRQVAGTFGYMDEIPYRKDLTQEGQPVAKYLHLIASNYCDKIVLGNYVNTVNPDHGHNLQAQMYVVNGLNPTNEPLTIYTIDLEDWFGENFREGKNEDGSGTGTIDISTWRNADPKYKHRKGSVFAANFLHPFAKIEGTPTFKLILTTDKEGQHVVNSWNVTLPEGPQINGTYPFWSYSTSWSQDETMQDTKSVYNVLRNHLYGIGVKAKTTPVDPDPENPGPDPDPKDDDPTPLNNKQEITLRVNSCWELIHQMGLE